MKRRPLVVLVALALGSAGTAALERDARVRLDRERAAIATLESLRTSDADLETSLLALRAGTLNHFDPIVRDVRALRRASALSTGAPGAPPADWRETELRRLVSDLGTKEQQVETLKTDHSLLRNSSLHFPMVAAALARYGVVSPEMDTLRASLERFSIAPSKPLGEEVLREADALDATKEPADAHAADARRSLVGHARSIVERRQRVDDLLREIRRSPVRSRFDQLVAYGRQMERRALVVVVAARTALAALFVLALSSGLELLMRRRRHTLRAARAAS